MRLCTEHAVCATTGFKELENIIYKSLSCIFCHQRCRTISNCRFLKCHKITGDFESRHRKTKYKIIDSWRNFEGPVHNFEVSVVFAYGPGARFTNDVLPAIQIRWKLRLAVIPLLVIRSQQIFAHATTAQLSCHVQNIVAITVLESRWECNEISIEFELRWKNRYWDGAQHR